MSGVPSWAVRGAKVVCLDDQDGWADSVSLYLRWRHRNDPRPGTGDICTIAAVQVDREGVWLELREYPLLFDVASFRPLVTSSQESDVAIFTPLLKVREWHDA